MHDAGDDPTSPEGVSDLGVPGVQALDHTADVGLDIRARSLDELFLRGAQGLMVLILDGPSHVQGLAAGSADERSISLSASDLPALFREWLREILYWYQDTGYALADITVRSVTRTELEVVVRGGPTTREPVREIKGVTLHGLEVERTDAGWRGQVIFDV